MLVHLLLAHVYSVVLVFSVFISLLNDSYPLHYYDRSLPEVTWGVL
jgi:hypothetical protein